MMSWTVLAGFVDPLTAYIDPGTGMAFLYALGAVATGIAFQFRRVKGWFAAKFTRR